MILCSGAFDGLHAGHVRYLRAAQQWSVGDYVYVAIAPDSYIREAKGREPYWSQAERAETVFALSCVDRTVFQGTNSVASVILETKPRLVVKGMDWKDRVPDDVLAACQAVGAELVFVDTPGRHVSEARC